MVMRFDPLRELERLAHEVPAASGTEGPRSFPMDAFRRGDRFLVRFDVPGVDPASIDLTVDRNVVTVRAERRLELEEGDELLVAERPQGAYARQLFLGDTLDADNIEAGYEAGVLTLTIPVAEAAKSRRVRIEPGGGESAA